MAILAKKIHIKNSAGTEQTVNLYSTTGEVATAASYTYQTVDGVECYAPLVATDHAKATSGRVLKGGVTYAWGSSTPSVTYTQWTQSAVGSGTFTVPTGVNKLRVTCVGGGAGAGLFPSYDCNASGTAGWNYFSKDSRGYYYNAAVGGAAAVFGSVVGNGATPWYVAACSHCCEGMHNELGTYTYCTSTACTGENSHGTEDGAVYSSITSTPWSNGAVPLTDYAGNTVFSAGAGGLPDGHSDYRRGVSGGSGYKTVAVIDVTPGQVISWSIGRRSKGWLAYWHEWCSDSCSSSGRNARAGGVGGILVEWGEGIE